MTLIVIDRLVDGLAVLQRADVIGEVVSVFRGRVIIIDLRDDRRSLGLSVTRAVMAHGMIVAILMEDDGALWSERIDQGVGERRLARAGPAGHRDKKR